MIRACPTPKCRGKLATSASLPLSFCRVCSTFTGEALASQHGVGFHEVLREIVLLEITSGVPKFLLLRSEQTVPVIAAYCNKDSQRFLSLLFQLNRSDIADTFYTRLAECPPTKYDDFKEQWSARFRANFRYESRDIEFFIDALGFAVGVLTRVSEYVAEDYVYDVNEKVDAGNISVNKAVILQGSPVIVTWNSEFADEDSAARKRSRKKRQAMSAVLTVTDKATNNESSYSVSASGSKEFVPEHDTEYTVVFKSHSRESLPQTVRVQVLPPLAIHDLRVSADAIIEGKTVEVSWKAEGYKSLKLIVRDTAFREETIDLTSQPDDRYTLAPVRSTTITLVAKSFSGQQREASVSVGVTPLPKFSMSGIAELRPPQINIESPQLPTLDFSFELLDFSSVSDHSLLPVGMRDKVRYYVKRLKRLLF